MDKKYPKICIIGAGFSGICMGIKLKTDLDIHSFTIIEACEEVGGTWLANTYPGCACDLPSLFYSFSFEQNYDWSHSYPPQAEILDYAKRISLKHGLYSHIKFHKRVETLRWNEQDHVWEASIIDIRRQTIENENFDIVINGTGKIRIPHYPKQYLEFTGPILHTAKWDHSIPLEGKRVGVIGTGASAVQVVPAIVNQVDSLTIFQRKAPYIIPRYQWEYSNTTRWIFCTFPFTKWLIRLLLFWLFEILFFPVTRYNSLVNKIVSIHATYFRNSKIKDLELRKKLTPFYPLGCKRVVPNELYFDVLTRPNVELITEKISGVKGNIIQTFDGRNVELDVLILATGFQQHDYFAPMKIIGREGVDVLEEWIKDRPQGYLGIASRTMPNLFTLLGPYSALGHSSNLFTIECQVQWTLLAIKELLRRGSKSMTLKRDPEIKFLKYVDHEMENTVWMKGGCEPWYLDKNGRNTMLWSGSQIRFWNLCRKFKPEIFEFN